MIVTTNSQITKAVCYSHIHVLFLARSIQFHRNLLVILILITCNTCCQICQSATIDLFGISDLSDHVHCLRCLKNCCFWYHPLRWLTSDVMFSVFVFVGSYAIRYMPRVLGAHQLSINIFDRPIKGSPFNLDVSLLFVSIFHISSCHV